VSQALYRTYRSKTLDEVVGQKPVTTALKNALKSGQLSHAYLFTGPRGVGKTSIARILAHEINNIPYESDELPLDIIEIDAASNRRIDEIRDLREKVRIAPVNAKYKVYIIDEVHMLTREAFNALLKTLEEPPAHVVFILATTEAHKLPETIVSRTQRYSFKLISTNEVVEHLKAIAKKEKINITDDALELIAIHSGGSLRDALSLLDQIRHINGTIDSESVQNSIGLPTNEHVENILNAVSKGDSASVIALLQQALSGGVSPTLLSQAIISLLKSRLSEQKPVLPLADSLMLMKNLLQVESSQQPEITLEIALLESIVDRKPQPITTRSESIKAGPPLTLKKSVTAAKRDLALHDQPKKVEKIQPIPDVTINKTELTLETWQTVLEDTRKTHNTLYSVLRMARLDTEAAKQGNCLLQFSFPFHQKRINEAKNKQIVLSKLYAQGIENIELICELVTPAKPEPVQEVSLEPFTADDMPARDEKWLEQIKTVFGGAEVLE
jgi:DNA polymerase III subunit gamma/tau